MLVFLHATRCGSVIFGSVVSTMLQGKHLQIFDEVKALKLIMFSNLQVFYLANIFFWSSRFLLPSLQLGWFLLSWFWPLLFRYSHSYLPRLFCCFFWRLVSDGNGSIGWDNTMYVEDHFFFVKQQKEGSNDLATHILRIVGRGSLLSLSHGRKLYK